MQYPNHPEITIPEDYRPLVDGEFIDPKDLFWSSVGRTWRGTYLAGQRYHADLLVPMIRHVPPKPEPVVAPPVDRILPGHYGAW